MPRFHFNVYDGTGDLDRDGTDLPDRMSAEREAIRLSGALLKDGFDRLHAEHPWRLEVTDQDGLPLFRIEMVITPMSGICRHPV